MAAQIGQPEAESVQSGEQGEEGDQTRADPGHKRDRPDCSCLDRVYRGAVRAESLIYLKNKFLMLSIKKIVFIFVVDFFFSSFRVY